jgi:hypothetical protein
MTETVTQKTRVTVLAHVLAQSEAAHEKPNTALKFRFIGPQPFYYRIIYFIKIFNLITSYLFPSIE